MQNIFITMLNEPGHLIPSYTLARKLKDTGLYNIIYIGKKEYESNIINQGFIFEEEHSYNNINFQHIYNIIGKPKNIIARYRWSFSIARELMRKELVSYFSNLMIKYEPVAIFVDDLLIDYMIAFYSYGAPIITVSTYLFSHMDHNIPPPNSTRTPNSDILNRFFIQKEWIVLFLRRFVKQFYFKILFPRGDCYHRSFAKLVKYPHKERITFKKAFWIGDKCNDTIVLCPKYFDFPRVINDNVHYIESCVDLYRLEEEFEWSAIKNNNPIVFCSLGTQAHKYLSKCSLFYKKIIEIFKHRPEYNLILSIGKTSTIEELVDLPENVYVYEKVPQIQILKRCIFTITHGGLGTVKECILLGVPMLVYPVNLQSDQNGNAARVAYHQIGLRGNIRKDNSKNITDALEEMFTNKNFKQNIINMQTKFVNYEKKEPFLNLFKSKLNSMKTIMKQADINEINYFEDVLINS